MKHPVDNIFHLVLPEAHQHHLDDVLEVLGVSKALVSNRGWHHVWALEATRLAMAEKGLDLHGVGYKLRPLGPEEPLIVINEGGWIHNREETLMYAHDMDTSYAHALSIDLDGEQYLLDGRGWWPLRHAKANGFSYTMKLIAEEHGLDGFSPESAMQWVVDAAKGELVALLLSAQTPNKPAGLRRSL